ncbi:MAG: hypothetical protein IK005_05155 [Paludibacteraceae bacterium]|nr:hypothetical protein [Paludibacteraceae bacterium]
MWQEGTELTIKEPKFTRFLPPIAITCLWIVGLVMMYNNCREYVNWSIALSIGFFGIFILTILCVLFVKNGKPIIVSKEGIELAEHGLIEWNRINYAYIEGVSRNHWIVVEVAGAKNVECFINTYKYDEEEFRRAVNYWSGRNIGSLVDKKQNFRLNEMETQENVSLEEEKYAKYRPLFEKELKKEKTIVSVASTLSVIIPIGFLIHDPSILNQKIPLVSLMAAIMGCLSYLFFVNNGTHVLLREIFLRTPPIAQLTETDITNHFLSLDESNYSVTKTSALMAGIIMFACIIVYNLQL